MNNGAFGENFPYSNFHDLNMDWIIKIAKDFLDQYTHIQEVIANGEESLQNLTTSGLTQLQEKADALEALLQQWYDTHSQDIANQLADALEDLNKWYTEHVGFLDNYVVSAKADFEETVDIKTAEALASIPEDYTELAHEVADHSRTLQDITEPGYNWSDRAMNFVATTGYWQSDGQYFTYANMYKYAFPVTPGTRYKLNGYSFWAACTIVFKNNDNFVSGIVISESVDQFNNYEFVIPENTNICEIYKHNETTAFSMFLGTPAQFLNITAESVYYNKTTKVSDILDECTRIKQLSVELTFSQQSGYYEQTGAFYAYDNVYAANVTVNSGEKYQIVGKNYYAIASVCYFYNNTFVSGIAFAENEEEYNETITIPSNVNKMLIQKFKNTTPTTLSKYTDIYEYKTPIYSITNILKNKKLTVIGDSITEYNYRAKTNWAMYIAEWTGAKIQNLGISGSGFSAGSKYIDRIQRIQPSPDIIGVAMSWNDMYSSLPLGTASDTDASTVAGCANMFFTQLISEHPTTPIICYCQGVWESCRPGIIISDTWMGIIKEICKLKGVPFYSDLYDGSVLRPWIQANREEYYKSDNDNIGQTGIVDNVHPNSQGHKVIARYLYPKFEQNLVTTGTEYTSN